MMGIKGSRAFRNLSPRWTALLKLALKTGLAGILSAYAAPFLGLPEGYWAVISAIIVMQSNVGATVTASRDRLAGTAIGALVGGVFVGVFGPHTLVSGVAVTLAILACALLRLPQSYRLAGVTVVILTLISREGSVWVLAVHRFLEVSLGILVALFVNATIWPSRAREHLRWGIAEALAGLDALYRAIVTGYREAPDDSISQLREKADGLMRRNEEFLNQASYEPAAGSAEQESLLLLMGHLGGFSQSIEALELATREGKEDAYYQGFEPELGRLVDGISRGFQALRGGVLTGRLPSDWPNLSQLTRSLDRQAAQMRQAGASAGYELSEIVRFYAFFLSLRSLAGELDLAFLDLCEFQALAISTPVNHRAALAGRRG